MSPQSNSPTAPANGKVLLGDNFPSKAFLVIQDCDSNASGVAQWSDDGKHFCIKDPVTFAASHLPQYFKHSNFQSFVRQLNAYGWRKRATEGKRDGSVCFHHPSFRRGRADLLDNITRTKKGTKQPLHQEEKKEEPSSFNARFDEMQQQIQLLGEKLDLLISLVSAKQDDYMLIDTTVIGKKRRRADSPVSDITDPPTMISKSAASVRENLEAIMEQEWEKEPIEEEKQMLEQNQSRQATIGEEEELEPLALNQATLEEACSHDEQDDDDFKMFIDTLLDSDEQNEQLEPDGATANDSDGTTHVTDNLRSKHSPHAVDGEMQIPQTTASAMMVVTDHDDYSRDEETGDAPLTTAVEVTDAITVEPKISIRTKRFIGVTIILILVAFIVWPCVVFLTRREEPPPRKPPKRPGFIPEEHLNETIRDRLNETVRGAIRDTVNETIGGAARDNMFDGNRGPPQMRAADDPLTIAWKGSAYECMVVIKSP